MIGEYALTQADLWFLEVRRDAPTTHFREEPKTWDETHGINQQLPKTSSQEQRTKNSPSPPLP
jgi:hypothetical protein